MSNESEKNFNEKKLKLPSLHQGSLWGVLALAAMYLCMSCFGIFAIINSTTVLYHANQSAPCQQHEEGPWAILRPTGAIQLQNTQILALKNSNHEALQQWNLYKGLGIVLAESS